MDKEKNKEWITTAELIAYLKAHPDDEKECRLYLGHRLGSTHYWYWDAQKRTFIHTRDWPFSPISESEVKECYGNINGRLNNEPRCNHGAAPRKGASPTRYDYNVFRRLRVSIRSLISFLGRRLFELRRRSKALIISPQSISPSCVSISVRNRMPETFTFSSVALSFNFLSPVSKRQLLSMA